MRRREPRHTDASILTQAGVPVKVVSDDLGHNSPALTMPADQHRLSGIQVDGEAALTR